MPVRSWKNWSLFITGFLTLFLPYSGLPQSIKNALLIIFGLVVTAVSASMLWPYHERRRSHRISAPRRTTHKEPIREPLSTVMPAESDGLSELPHDSV